MYMAVYLTLVDLTVDGLVVKYRYRTDMMHAMNLKQSSAIKFVRYHLSKDYIITIL